MLYRPAKNISGKSTILLTLWTSLLAILLISTTCLESVEAALLQNPFNSSSIRPLDCLYYKEHDNDHLLAATRLDQVCEDCYTSYREPRLNKLCKSNCYKNYYFRDCLKTLLKHDEVEQFQRMIIRINGGNPYAKIEYDPNRN